MISEAPDPPPLAIDVIHMEGAAVGVRVAGDIDAFTADRLRKSLMEVVDTYRPRSILMDCAGVAFLDAGGITALIGAREYAGRHRAEVRLLNTGRQVSRVLTLLGLDEVFGVAPPGGQRPADAPHGVPGAWS